MPIYDAFISYSHAKDKPIAAALQTVVQRLGKPWYRRRALRIFRDDTSLSATPELWPSIENALAQSRFLILLASPEAAASVWVGKEVAYWLDHKSPGTLLIGVTDGALTWDEATRDFIRRERSPLPAALTGRFANEPKWIDLGADFAAAVHGIPKEDLLSQEVRQQRQALGLAWAAAGSLLLLAGAAAWQWRDAVEQRKIAEAQRDRAERTLAAATRTADTLVFDLAQEFRKRTGMPIDLIRTVLERVQDLQRQLGQAGERPPDLQRLEIVALDELYSTYRSIGDTKAALDAAERARELVERMVQAFPTEVRLRRDLAIAINNVGDARYTATSRWEDSLALYRQALAVMERITDLLPGEARYQDDLSICLGKVADMLLVGGQRDEALATLRRSLAVVEKVAAADPENWRWQASVGFIQGRIGLVLVALGQSTAALDAYRASVALREKAAAAQPDNSGLQQDLHFSLNRMGALLITLGRGEEGLATLRRALAIIDKLAASDPANTQWQRELAAANDQIGDVLLSAKQATPALEAYRQGLAIRQKFALARPDEPSLRRDLAVSQNRIGDALRAAQQPAQATAAFEAALAIVRALVARDAGNIDWQRDLAYTLIKIGDVTVATDRPRARRDYEEALAIRERLATRDAGNLFWQADLAYVYGRLGELLVAAQEHEAALALYRKMLPIRKALAASDPANLQWQRDVALAHHHVATALVALDRNADAIAEYRESLVAIERYAAANEGAVLPQIDLVIYLFQLALMGDEARPRLERALTIARKLDADGRLTTEQKIWIGYLEQGLAALPPP